MLYHSMSMCIGPVLGLLQGFGEPAVLLEHQELVKSQPQRARRDSVQTTLVVPAAIGGRTGVTLDALDEPDVWDAAAAVATE